jgi:Fe-S-cluster-containing dehydrogenase component
VVEKCTFCAHRTLNGMQPACVEVCPSQARIFGDQEDPKSQISQVLKAQKSFRLKEEAGTQPNVHYVGKYSARA